MKELSKLNSGDVVYSVAGRDKGNLFLVVDLCDRYVFLVDGKKHKVNSPKKKNVKHVKLIKSNSLCEYSQRISDKKCVGNRKIYQSIHNAIKK